MPNCPYSSTHFQNKSDTDRMFALVVVLYSQTDIQVHMLLNLPIQNASIKTHKAMHTCLHFQTRSRTH